MRGMVALNNVMHSRKASSHRTIGTQMRIPKASSFVQVAGSKPLIVRLISRLLSEWKDRDAYGV